MGSKRVEIGKESVRQVTEQPFTFANVLRAYRWQEGLSLREAAADTGISYTYLSKVERGMFPPPSAETIKALAKRYNASYPDELLAMAGKIDPDIVEYLIGNKDALARVRREMEGKGE